MSKKKIPKKLREQVGVQSKFRCDYCFSQEEMVGMNYTVDHIYPETLGGKTDLENLCLCCWDCNLIKQKRISGVDPNTGEERALYHPRQDSWSEHFRWEAKGLYQIGKTPKGRATVLTLKLNRKALVKSRRHWINYGWHPPTD